MERLKSMVLFGLVTAITLNLTIWNVYQPTVLAQISQPKTAHKPTPTDAKPHAVRRGRTIYLKPSGARFKIPQDWLKWHRESNHNIYLSRKELEVARAAVGEGHRTFSEIVNSVLSFDRCAVHVGGSTWSSKPIDSGSGILQTRVYTGQLNIANVWKRVESEGLRKASEDFAREKGSEPSVITVRRGQWQGRKLSYELFFGDYSSDENIEFLARRFGNQAVIFVFMYNPGDNRNEKQLKQILNSFVRKS